jgi:hypothetical protein
VKYSIHKKAYIVGEADAIDSYRQNGGINSDGTVEMVHSDGPSQPKVYFSYMHGVDYINVRCIRDKKYDLLVYGDRHLTLERIKSIETYTHWMKTMKEMVTNNPGASVRIYSSQWGSYWRTNSMGYTSDVKEAGIYGIKEAWENVSHCGIEKQISFEIVDK